MRLWSTGRVRLMRDLNKDWLFMLSFLFTHFPLPYPQHFNPPPPWCPEIGEVPFENLILDNFRKKVERKIRWFHLISWLAWFYCQRNVCVCVCVCVCECVYLKWALFSSFFPFSSPAPSFSYFVLYLEMAAFWLSITSLALTLFSAEIVDTAYPSSVEK